MSRRCRSTAPTGRRGSRTPTTRGIPIGRPTERRSCGRNGICRTCRGTRRGSCAATATARRSCWRVVSNPTVVAARAASPVSRPGASTSRGSDDGELVVDGEPLLPRQGQESAEPAWSAGQRSFAWSPDGDELAWCRNESGFGRLVIGAPGPEVGAGVVARLAPRPRLGRRAGIVCVRSGAVTPGRSSCSRPNGSGRRAIARGPVGGFERPGSSSPGRSCGSRAARRCTVCCGGPRTATGAATDGRARPRRPDRPGARRLEPAGAVARAAGLHRVPAEPSRFDRLRRDRTATRSTVGGASATSPTSSPVSSTRSKRAGPCPARIAVMGGSAGGFTALNVAAQHPDLVAAVVALYPVTDLLDLAATTHRFESGDLARLVGPLPGARDDIRRPLADHARRARARPGAVVAGRRRPRRQSGAHRGVRRRAARARVSRWSARVRGRRSRLAARRDRRRRARPPRGVPRPMVLTGC